jgi:hypothetical protein
LGRVVAWCGGALLLGAPASAAAQAPVTLENAGVRLEFGPRGLVSFTERTRGETYRFRADEFSVTLDGVRYQSATLEDPLRRLEARRVTYAWSAGPYRLETVYQLEPDWHFASKQLRVTGAPGPVYRVDQVAVFRAALEESPAEVFVPPTARPRAGTADYGVALRFVDGRGLLVAVQNPFLHSERDADRPTEFRVSYAPAMSWRSADGDFVADRGLIAPYRLTGRRQPLHMTPEWRYGPADDAPGLDEAEVATFTDLVRAFLLHRPARPTNIFVGWCVNDYQIDIATAAGRAEYRRIMDRAAELGAEYVLFAPTNAALSRRVESADDWSWENLLWLGLGQRLRRSEWDPRRDAVPPAVQEMLDYARSRGLKLVAYVYPVVPFSQNREWLVRSPRDSTRYYANLGVRSLQDWLIETLVAFHQRTGIGGYAFDHTFLDYPGTSPYAQWWGWRRVMEELRRRVPDIVMDGRQAYHLYGPWSWLAGSYPHPTFNDEQPESFVPFPDLHFDRVSAARQRYTAYLYRKYEFAPSEIVPGFITHQTPRIDDTGRMPETRTEWDVFPTPFRLRDWDYLGWRYSLLSSIATGGWNNVLNMIPARDTAEFRQFSPGDIQWFRDWIAWTDQNRDFLRHTRAILGQPALGKPDGTAAIVGDRGYLFLFNPNGRRLAAALTLDSSIGLTEGTRYLVRELYPLSGRLVGSPDAGVWARGDRLSLMLDGGSARVLEIQPAEAVDAPLLFNAAGGAEVQGGTLTLTGLRGEAGSRERVLVVLPRGRAVTGVHLAGRPVPFSPLADNVVALDVTFAGAPFRQLQPVGDYDPSFRGGPFRGTFTVPRRVFDQLAARRRAWPIPWTSEDRRTPWLVPERLLLFVQIAEPDDQWEVRMRIDEQPVELTRAYSSIRPYARAFVGFYADLSHLDPDRPYTVELELPPLRPGQFQGLFFENVEPEYTEAVVR